VLHVRPRRGFGWTAAVSRVERDSTRSSLIFEWVVLHESPGWSWRRGQRPKVDWLASLDGCCWWDG
jgi:hypothetical protein